MTVKHRRRSPSTLTMARRQAAEAALKSGVTPLQYMLGVMRDESADRERRDAMAIAAAPYLHARLSATTLSVRRIADMTEAEIMEFLGADGKQAGDGQRPAADAAGGGSLASAPPAGRA